MTGCPAPRRRRAALVFFASPWLWTRAPATSAAAPSEWRLHARGLGPLTVGMAMIEALRLPGIEFEWIGPATAAGNACTYYLGRHAGREFRARVVSGLVNRIELARPGYATRSGVAVGDSLARLKTAYGPRLALETLRDAGGRGYELGVLGPYRISGRDYGVAFEAAVAQGVTGIRAGYYEEIRRSEGCG